MQFKRTKKIKLQSIRGALIASFAMVLCGLIVGCGSSDNVDSSAAGTANPVESTEVSFASAAKVPRISLENKSKELRLGPGQVDSLPVSPVEGVDHIVAMVPMAYVDPLEDELPPSDLAVPEPSDEFGIADPIDPDLTTIDPDSTETEDSYDSPLPLHEDERPVVSGAGPATEDESEEDYDFFSAPRVSVVARQTSQSKDTAETIRLIGFIQASANSEHEGKVILKLGDRLLQMAEGSQHDDLEVLKIEEHSVTIQHGRERRTLVLFEQPIVNKAVSTHSGYRSRQRRSGRSSSRASRGGGDEFQQRFDGMQGGIEGLMGNAFGSPPFPQSGGRTERSNSMNPSFSNPQVPGAIGNTVPPGLPSGLEDMAPPGLDGVLP